MQELRSYLGIQEDQELRVHINSQVPDFSVNLDEALALAYETVGYTDDETKKTGK